MARKKVYLANRIKWTAVYLTRKSGYNNPIGTIIETADGFKVSGPFHAYGTFPYKYRAILHLVHGYITWIGLSPGVTEY